MVIPFHGEVNTFEDTFNFYISQICIKIERNFGLLVHRWLILQNPLDVPIEKNPALTMALCKLHNFLIEENE